MSNTRYSKVKASMDFDAIKISIASSDDILSQSFGEVTRAETINYRTVTPEKDGLFCAKIFGPIKDYECSCGKYKRQKYKGIICDKCGVEVTTSSVRRYRSGHIVLASPVVNPIFLSSKPSPLAFLLGMKHDDIEQIIYFEKDVVIESNSIKWPVGTVLSFQKSIDIKQDCSHDVVMSSGAEAILRLLENTNIDELLLTCRANHKKTGSSARKKKLEKDIIFLESILKSGNKISDMVLFYIPVIPPSVRPLFAMEGMRFASSDLNELYRRLINRSNRLKKLQNLQAPQIVLRNEKRMLQDAVIALFDNSKSGRPFTNNRRQVFKSISDYLRGKQGIFRNNVVGKRVDYSGRSAITVGPLHKITECGLPKEMALELFRPFLYNKILQKNLAPTLRAARNMINNRDDCIWEILEQVTYNHPILLNRAPTLHKVSIQAFYPRLTNSKAIELHPLVCSGFNADFDGDSMAVHVPISEEARTEAATLMLSSNHLLSNANGQPLVGLSQDIVLGLYWATTIRGKPDNHRYTTDEVINSYKLNYIKLNQAVRCVIDEEEVIVCPGMILLHEEMRDLVPFYYWQDPCTKKHLSSIVTYLIEHYDKDVVCVALNKIMHFGFEFCTLAGMSFRISDMVTLPHKEDLLNEAREKVGQKRADYNRGLLTSNELSVELIELWSHYTDTISNQVIDYLQEQDKVEANHLHCMFTSGARGSKTQIRQIVGMRGLMVKPDGTIIPRAVESNFKEGIDCLSYFNSTHGSRKGLFDTALNTANSGYMFRKLADCVRDIIISSHDCGTDEGIEISSILEGDVTMRTVGSQALWRYAAEDVTYKGSVIVHKNELITRDKAALIDRYLIDKITIRSPITCIEKGGMCSKCYGYDLSTQDEPILGDPVGIIAAQSIGEPGTQMTMRTFHKGGVSDYAGSESEITVKTDGTVQFRNMALVQDSNDDWINLGFDSEIRILSDGSAIEHHLIKRGAIVYVQDGQKITKGTILSYADPGYEYVLSTSAGTARFSDIERSVNVTEDIDKLTGIVTKTVKSSMLRPQVFIDSEDTKVSYTLLPGMSINIADGQIVKAGDRIATTSIKFVRSQDIVSGLPLITQLFDMRVPKDAAILSKSDGIVSISSAHKRNQVVVKSEDGTEMQYSIPINSLLVCYAGQSVAKGDSLTAGSVDFKQLTNILGEKEVGKRLTSVLQAAYLNQGIDVNNKHFEVIISKMLGYGQVISSDNDDFTPGHTYELKSIKRAVNSGSSIQYTALVNSVTTSIMLSDSFLCSSSFQDTTRRLTNSALVGAVDNLAGSKERILVGRKCNMGTGFYDSASLAHTFLKYKTHSINIKEAIKETLYND